MSQRRHLVTPLNLRPGESGGLQYIHQEHGERQDIMNQLHWPSTLDALERFGIRKKSENSRGDFKVLEIGCGTGSTTFSLAKALPKASVTGIDTSEEMISFEKSKLSSYSEDIQDRVKFSLQNGETVGDTFPQAFDMVWLRFVVVHVPDPIRLLQSAKKALKPGGILFVEDVDQFGQICDPPSFEACDLLQKTRAEASRKMGGDVERGRMIGEYFRQLELDSIRCHSFVPLYGRGVAIEPWGGRQVFQEYDSGQTNEDRYQLGLVFIVLTLESLTPNLLRLGLASPDDIARARDSISRVSSPEVEYQIFSFPGGKIFQWVGEVPVS